MLNDMDNWVDVVEGKQEKTPSHKEEPRKSKKEWGLGEVAVLAGAPAVAALSSVLGVSIADSIEKEAAERGYLEAATRVEISIGDLPSLSKPFSVNSKGQCLDMTTTYARAAFKVAPENPVAEGVCYNNGALVDVITCRANSDGVVCENDGFTPE